MPGAARLRPGTPLFATRHRGLKAQLMRLSRTLDAGSTVLILGAPGTGKDHLARLLHERSRRRGEPFLRIDLAAVPDDLFESELFGHERGAFTGAVAGKPGLLEGAGEGTLYLDRIDVLSARAQGKLLRVVEERLFRRVGGTRPLSLKARLVASAGPDLPRRARTGSFREDLFYRLAVVTVRLPTLAERRDDIVAAARAISREAGGPGRLTPAAEELLRGAAWRGNWRELENVVRRGALEAMEAAAPALDAAHLTLAGREDPETLLAEAARCGWTLRRLTDAYIDVVLEETGGNVAEAARRLGIARKTLYERRRGRV
ncbi:MAG TPA: sigma 54-interacting transcriptional regulator [Thermoanaerobaculia bacterium]|nr:sigma 54-interacting transcriptional regulator [Thermoanaerobaculia bacterium]HQR68415.1 sigma 54-interacting transcriptional regulator [Thermoanaerobaculia bacterium]